ncbi:MAG: sulfatase-like hydrolase/transferase, partial [Saprospiraceae bacterium]|nr:sulfatase-like hydrolase/transferase [Saprospiraceae bacterium]
DSGTPFFAYLAYTAPHDPLQAPRAYIVKYKGVYDEGYEVFLEKRFESLKKKNLIPTAQNLPTWPDLVPKWSDLSDARKQNIIRDMETYAAMVDYMDEQIGRVYSWLEENDALDNTFIIFISDNGASGLDSKKIYPEYTEEYASKFNNEMQNRGMINSFTNMNSGWAVASTVLYRDFKGFTTEGGIRTPCFIKHIKESSKEVCSTFTHVRDIMHTILDIAGVGHPSSASSEMIKMLGKSLVPVLNDPSVDVHKGEGIGYELHGTRAFIKDGWKIIQGPVPIGTGDWELFNLNEDLEERNNLIFSNQDKFNEMLVGYNAYEEEVGVIYELPLFLGTAKNVFNIIFWLLIAVFGLAVLGKLSGKMKSKYIEWGYGTAFMYVLAAAELLAIVVLFTIYHRFAAYFLVLIMAGAFYTMIRNKENWKAYLLPLFATILLGLYLLLKSGLMIKMML